VLVEHAPDLTADFMLLAQLSQNANNGDPLIKKGSKPQRSKTDLENEKSERLDEAGVNEAIRRRDFAHARKLIEKLGESSKRSQLTEIVNTREALYLLTKDEFGQATRLAEKTETGLIHTTGLPGADCEVCQLQR
jgi:hypothetical protein